MYDLPFEMNPDEPSLKMCDLPFEMNQDEPSVNMYDLPFEMNKMNHLSVCTICPLK